MKDSYHDSEHGVSVSFIHGEPYSILTEVQTNIAYRGCGHASRVLDEALRDADIEKITLILGIEPDGTSNSLSSKQLADWYERKGFEFWHTPNSMIRKPIERA